MIQIFNYELGLNKPIQVLMQAIDSRYYWENSRGDFHQHGVPLFV